MGLSSYATIDFSKNYDCINCNKNDQDCEKTDASSEKKDISSQCKVYNTMCSECITAELDEDEHGWCYEDHEDSVKKCKKYLKKSGLDVPLTPEETIIQYTMGSVFFSSSLSSLCLILLTLLCTMK